MNKKSKPGNIIIPYGVKPRPRKHEIEVAEILAKYFSADVEFIPTSTRKSADFLINGVKWELKSPQGKGKNNLQRQLKYASKQSKNIIISADRSKLHINKITGELRALFNKGGGIKRLILISKSGEIIEFNR